MYGETPSLPCATTCTLGLSPHVRGNPAALRAPRSALGSIPACTGKPRSPAPARCRPGVYPRMYGETGASSQSREVGVGLSPHVRGNHSCSTSGAAVTGSIPACTGKPAGPLPGRATPAVYPRMYGETTVAITEYDSEWGLSPHVRGNRRSSPPCHRTRGSIPACTGKPFAPEGPARRSRVYPRMYGETTGRPVFVSLSEGLSPHVRGNLHLATFGVADRGSIPACTGKPTPTPR